MGIDKKRFANNIEVTIERFLCGICEDVASDPILTKQCEHYMCLGCITADINICPTCGSTFDCYIELGIALRRIYSDINIRCVYDGCNEILTIENYMQHERKCPYGFYECPNYCGFKVQLSLDEEYRKHNCIEVLKTKILTLEMSNADLQAMNYDLNEQLKTVGNHKKRRVSCGIVLSKGEQFYRCFTCQARRLSVICVDCFEHGDHENHRYTLMTAENNTGCYCDCGDTGMLKPETLACSKHKV